MVGAYYHAFLLLILLAIVPVCVGFTYRETKLSWPRMWRSKGTFSDPSSPTADHVGIWSKIELNIKLPTNDRQTAQSFISSTDYLVESMFSNAKKVAPNKYLVRVRPMPLPRIGIVSPEIEIFLENKNGAVHVRSNKWSLRDGDGLSLQNNNTAVDSLDVTLRGLLRIVQQKPHSKISEKDNLKSGVLVKRPVGGFPVFAEGFLEYRVSDRIAAAGLATGGAGAQPSSLISGPTGAIIQRAADHFLSYGLSKKLARACKDFIVAAVARDLS